MSKQHPRVLVAEDDPHLRLAITKRLQQGGFEVVATADGTAACLAIDSQTFDAAILDIMMPETDGFGVCEHIRALGNAMPVFFLTGATEGIVRNHLGTLTKAVGGNHFLTKPYDAKALTSLLWDAIQSNNVPTA